MGGYVILIILQNKTGNQRSGNDTRCFYWLPSVLLKYTQNCRKVKSRLKNPF